MSRDFEVWAVLLLIPIIAFSSLALFLENWDRASASEPSEASGDASVGQSEPGASAGQSPARARGLGWPWT